MINIKKTLLFLLISIIIIVKNTYQINDIVIPSDAIRLRVIANSNEVNDQYMKKEVQKLIEQEIKETMQDVKSITQAREIINNKITDFKTKITKLFEEKKYQEKYTINYGDNYFPQKEYKGITYKEGQYESLVITIGNGEGNNWWCVLFPPLCLLEAEETTDVEYKFKVVELIKNIIR